MKTEGRDFMNEFTRLKGLSSRMVGLYRLVVEQQSESSIGDIYIEDPKESFDELKNCIISEVRNKVKSEKIIENIIKNANKEQGSLNEILFSSLPFFPKQTLLIRVGNAVESAIRKYLTSKYEDVSSEISPLIKGFLDRTVQLDVAIRKDNTYFISELKYNFNLDTEKTAKVIEKLDLLSIALKKFYNKNNINTKVSFVSLRYPHVDDIVKLNSDFKAIKKQYIVGYVDFFKFFNINVTKEEWEAFHATLGDELLQTYFSILNKDKSEQKIKYAI